jgi:hypothetical protein
MRKLQGSSSCCSQSCSRVSCLVGMVGDVAAWFATEDYKTPVAKEALMSKTRNFLDARPTQFSRVSAPPSARNIPPQPLRPATDRDFSRLCSLRSGSDDTGLITIGTADPSWKLHDRRHSLHTSHRRRDARQTWPSVQQPKSRRASTHLQGWDRR